MCSNIRSHATGVQSYGVQANGTMPTAIVFPSTMPMKEHNACSACANVMKTGIPVGIAAGTNPVRPPLRGFAAAAVALAHFAFVANDYHGAPVFDEMVGAFPAEKFDHARKQVTPDHVKFSICLLSIPL